MVNKRIIIAKIARRIALRAIFVFTIKMIRDMALNYIDLLKGSEKYQATPVRILQPVRMQSFLFWLMPS